MTIYANVSKVNDPWTEECYRVFSYRSMTSVTLTKNEAMFIALELLSKSGSSDLLKCKEE